MKKAQAQYAEKRNTTKRPCSATGSIPTCSVSRSRSGWRPITPEFRRDALRRAQAPKPEDNEKSLAELIARVEKTVDYLKTVEAKQIDGTEEKSVTIKRPTGDVQMKGLELLLNRIMPNFMFHATTAYDILRHNGLEIGKRDFMGG